MTTQLATSALVASCLRLSCNFHFAALKKNRASLIRKVYAVNPLVCPECNGLIRITGSQATKLDDFVKTRRGGRHTKKLQMQGA